MKNFLGQDGFIWWIGVVEDVNDPLRLGRCRVRCFGYHPPKKDVAVPKDDLPWAISIHSPNTPNLYATPNEGDWVVGFFLDGPNAQEPAIMGYIPGIPQNSEEYFGAQPRKDSTGKAIRSFAKVAELAEAEKQVYTPDKNVINYVVANIRNPQAIANGMRIFNLNTAQVAQLLGIPEELAIRYFETARIKDIKVTEANTIPSNLIRWDSKVGHYIEMSDIPGTERLTIQHANGYSLVLNNDGIGLNLVSGPSLSLSTSNVVTLTTNSLGSMLKMTPSLNFLELSQDNANVSLSPSQVTLKSHSNGSIFTLSNNLISLAHKDGANIAATSNAVVLSSHPSGSSGTISNNLISLAHKDGANIAATSNAVVLSSHPSGSSGTISNNLISFVSIGGANVAVNTDTVSISSHNQGSVVRVSNTAIQIQSKDGANALISDSKTILYSKTGHFVDLNDTANKITIKHKGGTEIVIDSVGKITINALDDIAITSSDITINADNFTLNADNVDINSTGTLDLSGASGSITTSGGLNVHASGTLDLQGSTININ